MNRIDFIKSLGLASTGLITQVSQHNPKDSYQSIAVEVFADLITPTPQLLTALQNARASDAEDLYRQGY